MSDYFSTQKKIPVNTLIHFAKEKTIISQRTVGYKSFDSPPPALLEPSLLAFVHRQTFHGEQPLAVRALGAS
jgi:hypothetical protein